MTSPTSIPLNQSCLYCHGSHFLPLFDNIQDRFHLAPGTWNFDSCESCGSAILRPFPKIEELNAYYPSNYHFAPELAPAGSLRRLLATLESKFYYEAQNRFQVSFILNHLKKLGAMPKTLLDLGSGRGLRLREFKRQGLFPHGVDFHPEAVSYLKQVLQIPATCSELTEIESHFPLETFDLITAFYVLEHVPNVREIINSSLKLLKPGGWLIAAVPVSDCLQAALLKEHWSAVTEAPRHYSLPSQKGIKALYEMCGLVQVHTVADSVLASAGGLGLSFFKNAATPCVYGNHHFWSIVLRIFTALVTLFFIPLCWFENVILRRPALIMVIGRKPGY